MERKEFVKKLVNSVGLRRAEVGECGAGLPLSHASSFLVFKEESFRLELGSNPDVRGLTVKWEFGLFFQKV